MHRKTYHKWAVPFIMIICLFLPVQPGFCEKQKKVVWKVASLAPKNVGWAKHLREIIIPAMDRATNNTLEVKWYWGGVMGEDKDYLQKMRIGQLDGAALSGRGVVLGCPEMSVLELPFMFNDYDEVDYVRKKMFPTFDAIVEKRGYKFTAWGDQDFDQIYSTKYKMDTLDDFRKAKFLTWYGPLEQHVLETLGASPVPMGVTEISPAVRQGIVDTMIMPAVWIVGAQMYTIVKHVNPVKIRYSPVSTFINLDSWNELAPEYRENLLKMREKEGMVFIKKARTDSKKALEAMIQYGVKKTVMEPAHLADMKEKCKKLWFEMAGREFPKSLLEELLAHLAEYRAKQ